MSQGNNGACSGVASNACYTAECAQDFKIFKVVHVWFRPQNMWGAAEKVRLNCRWRFSIKLGSY